MDVVAARGAVTARPLVAIVLAGGRGERLGHALPKAMVPLAGRTLLERAVSLAASAADVVLVAAPAGMSLAIPEAVSRVDDLVEGGGPLAGLVPALERAASLGAGGAFILAVDLPGLARRDLHALVARGGEAAAIVPRSARGLEPQVAFVADVPSVARAFRAAWDAGERSLHGAFRRLGPALATLDVSSPAAWPGGDAVLRGVNTPEEFAAAERAALEAADPAT